MSRFRGRGSLNFGFESLIFATSGIFSMHKQLVTLQRQRKTWNRINLCHQIEVMKYWVDIMMNNYEINEKGNTKKQNIRVDELFTIL